MEPTYIIFNHKHGEELTEPLTLKECNNGSQAYPKFLADQLQVGQTLKSSFNDERAIKRVA